MAKMFYSADEAATKLNLTPEKIKELVESNKLREFRDGTRVMFKVDQVDRLAADPGSSEAGGASGGPIDLEPMSATGVAAALASSDTDAPNKSGDTKSLTALAGVVGSSSAGGTAAGGTAAGTKTGGLSAGTSTPGIKVFDENEVQAADPKSQTQISSGVDESISP